MLQSVLVSRSKQTNKLSSELLNHSKEDRLLGIKTSYNYVIWVSLDGSNFIPTEWVENHSKEMENVSGKVSEKRMDREIIQNLWFQKVIITKNVSITDTNTGKVLKSLSWYEVIKPIVKLAITEEDFSKALPGKNLSSNNILYIENNSKWIIVHSIIKNGDIILPVGDMTNINSIVRKTNKFDITPNNYDLYNIVITKEKGKDLRFEVLRAKH